jgi:hypothetical protein
MLELKEAEENEILADTEEQLETQPKTLEAGEQPTKPKKVADPVKKFLS